MTRWTVTLYNATGAVAWTGDYSNEDEAKVCLANAEIAAVEMGGRAEMTAPPACDDCDGTGVRSVTSGGFGEAVTDDEVKCEACGGSGRESATR